MEDAPPPDAQAKSKVPPADETFSDMVTLGPPPVPDDHDDSAWHDGMQSRSATAAIRELKQRLEQRYQRRKELGAGGMATVFDSVDLSLRRHVAVKVIHARHARKEGSEDERSPMQRFIDEAQITAQLEHPNIVPVHEIGIDDEGNAYFTMKRIEGRSLRDVFDDMRAGDATALEHYSFARCVDVLIKVCDAIAFAHSRDVIHRDLKPDNVMVGRFGEVQVMDWGLAKVMSDSPEAATPRQATETFTGRVSLAEENALATIEGTISGTPAYMPPEQARGQVNQVDERSDIFLLGALLYEMLTLVPPFHAESSMAALRRAQRYEIPSVAEMAERIANNPELEDETIVHPDAVRRASLVPKELAAIAMKAVAEKSSERYQNVEALIADLERYQRGESVSVYDDPPLRALGKWASRHRALSFSMGFGLIVTLLAMIVILSVQKRRADDLSQSSRLLLAEETQRQEAEARERKLREETEKRERERRDIEARENRERIEALLKRRQALAELDLASDKLARAAGARDQNLRKRLREAALGHLEESIAADASFGRPFIVRGQTYLQLGSLRSALDNLLEGLHLQREVEKTQDDPALLMTIAMVALAQGEILGHSNLDSVYMTALERILRVGESAGSYGELARLLYDAEQYWRDYERASDTRERIEVLSKLNQLVKKVTEIQDRNPPGYKGRDVSGGTDLWEVHFFAAALKVNRAEREARPAVREDLLMQANRDLKRALTLQPQLPVVVSYQTKVLIMLNEMQPNSNLSLDSLLTPWNKYIAEFPDDPLGYFARARKRLEASELFRIDSTDRHYVLGKIENDLWQALNWNNSFSEALDLLGVASELRGNLSEARRLYNSAFLTGWSPILESPDEAQALEFRNMSHSQRHLRVSVRLDAQGEESQDGSSRTISLLQMIHERCVEGSDDPASWLNYRQSTAVYRSAFKTALDEAVKQGFAALVPEIAEKSMVRVPQDQDYLMVSQAFARIGDFDGARRYLTHVPLANPERRDLEREISRLEATLNGQPVDLSAEESLISARIQRRQGVSDPSLKQLSMVGVIGATRLASATEVQEVLEAIIKGEGVFPDKTSQPTKDETTIRLYRHMLSEDPARAFNLGTTINVLALLKRIDERNK